MSRFTTTKTLLTDFLVSVGHVIETITLCVFAPTVGEYVNRTSDSTIVQAPTAIQRMTTDAQASIYTSSTHEHKNDNEYQILPVQVLTPVENEKNKWPAKFTPKRWFRKHVKMTTNAAQSKKADSTTQKNRRNFFSVLIHGKKKIPDTEPIDANDNLEREVETGGLSIPTATRELDAQAKDDDGYGTAGDLNSMTSEVDDDNRSMISVRYLTACIAELEAEQEKRIQESGVVADDIPAMFLNRINGNITNENMKASIADADGVYEVGDMTLFVLFELPEVDSANRCYHANTTSTAPLADTTGSSTVEEYCAPENQIDDVSDAEADMPSPIENPAEHETAQALADTSPEPNAGSTNEEVSLLTNDTNYRDMKMPVCAGVSIHVMTSEHCTSTHDEPPLVTYACVESTENDNDGGVKWIDADISFGDILSQPYEPVLAHESTTAFTAVSAEAEGTPADTCDDFLVSDVSFTDVFSNTAAEHEINSIRALADTSPQPKAGSTNEQVSLLAEDTVDRNMKLPVSAGESIHVTMHDVTHKTFESGEEHVVSSEHCTSTLDELPLVTYACVESTENDNDGGVDWIDADISFGDILSQPYEPVSSHESTTAITADSAEAEDTHADICDDFFVCDLSFTDILFNTAGRESENDSTPREHSTDPSTTPMMGSGTSSPVSTTATTPIEVSDDTIVGGEKELFAEILFVNDEEWCLPVPDDGCRSNVSVSSSVAAAEIERKTDITAPVTEYSHVVIPAEYRAPYIPVNAPVQDLESQDTNHVTTSLFASCTLSRVKSVLSSSFCSVSDTSETISDILVSFPPSIRRVLKSDLNTKDIFHGTCDHANPTGCANCSEKLNYLKRVRYGITASSCSDEDESVTVARIRDNVLRGRRL
ncbi:hypothetical protein V1515DRAFT_580305 [Lipomyces mesembrius]